VSTVIVYVHGLWVTGREAFWLRRRLEQDLEAKTLTFPYPSVTTDATTNARALAKFLAALRADTLHLVGHSLGGLVILKLFEEGADAPAQLPPGRIVLLGSPLCGSRAARNLARLPFGKKIMGLGATEELLAARERRWNGARDLGVIAGDLSFGLGRLVGTLGGPSDGTILVEETELDGTADRLVLRVSHTGMLFSAVVARAAGAFLSTGRFRTLGPGASVQLLQSKQ
jgi:pimeloyl-ACP methyl ester carboxylesterase